MAAQPENIASVPAWLTPHETVDAANEVASEMAAHPHVRQLAAGIVRDLVDIPAQGPERIARWIRTNILYTQEAVGHEVLQGPLTTLRIRTGDCDDLSILFASLCRALNLQAFVVGLRYANSSSSFFHAVGWCRGIYYELSEDQTYGGPGASARAVVMGPALPAEWVGYAYDPVTNAPKAMSGRKQPLTPELLGRSIQDGLSRSGIRLPSALTNDVLGAGQTIASIAKPLSSLAGGGGALSGALGALGVSGAAGPIGAAIAIAGLAAKLLSDLGRQKRNAARAGNRFNASVEIVVQLLAQSPEQAALVRARLWEGIPVWAGTENRRGRGGREISVGTLRDRRPQSGATWADGTTGKRGGVFETFRGRRKGQRSAMNAHRAAVLTLAESLAQMPREERQSAFRELVVSVFGERAAFGLPGASRSQTPRPRPPQNHVALAAALPVAALLFKKVFS
ncbi:MAG: hypothetical protein ACI82G_000898 [Bradymonadia bacterium]